LILSAWALSSSSNTAATALANTDADTPAMTKSLAKFCCTIFGASGPSSIGLSGKLSG
jgi:bisphosphoglycerate-independent phosphoglycerate mutase (AlkP superfamily)